MLNAKSLGIVSGLLIGLGAAMPTQTADAGVPAFFTVGVDELDTITFRDGKVVKGIILEETPTTLRVKVVSYGIEAVTTYNRADVLAITRGERTDAAETEVVETIADSADAPNAKREIAVSEAEHRVYHIKLDGRFGKEITQTPLRDALEDAAKNNADYIIIEIENEWKASALQELPDEEARFDELFRAESMHPLLNRNEDLAQIYAGKQMPTVVFWVKKAMGGATFLPLICRNIYFHEDGKMGGIGNLGDLFGSMGDEVVRDKQKSLRMGHAEGIAIIGGYPTELIHAMADRREVYSYRISGGKVEFRNDWPDPSRGWRLLTDDGEDGNKDTIQQLARSQGNDTLTLDARLAQTLQVSKGTVNTLDALVFELGLSRNSVIVEGNSDRIMDRWESGLSTAERRLKQLWREYNEIQIQGQTPRERNADRGRQIRKLEDMIKLIKRYEEAVSTRELRIPGEGDLRIIIERIRLDMIRDR